MWKPRHNPTLYRWRAVLAWVLAVAFHLGLFIFAISFEPARSLKKGKRGPYYVPPLQIEIREVSLPEPRNEGEAELTRQEVDVSEFEAEHQREMARKAGSEIPDPVAASPLGSEAGLAPSGFEGKSGSPENEKAGKPRSSAPAVVELFDPEVLRGSFKRWDVDRQKRELASRGARLGRGGSGNEDGMGEVGQEGVFDGSAQQGGEARVVAGRINAQLAHAKAVSRVLGGLVDPYFRNLAHGVASSDELEDALEVPQRLQSAGRRFFARWAEDARHFGSSGRWESLPDTAVVDLDYGRPGFHSMQPLYYALRLDSRSLELSTGHVLIQLTQAADGEPLELRIVSSSGSHELDSSALAAVREAAAKLRIAGPGLAREGSKVSTLWRLETARSARSVLPRLEEGLENEAEKSGTEQRAANRTPSAESAKARLVKTRLELLAIYGGRQPVQQLDSPQLDSPQGSEADSLRPVEEPEPAQP